MNDHLSLANSIKSKDRHGPTGAVGRLRFAHPLSQNWERLPSATRWGAERAARLAQVVSTRYAVRVLPRPSLDFAYRHHRPVINVQTVLQHSQVHVAPRLTFTLVNRLFRRTERIEAGESPRSPAVTGPTASPLQVILANKESSGRVQPAILPVPSVVRRPVSVTAAAHQQPAPETPAVSAIRRPPAGPEPIPPASASIDVNHLTDQIIQTIDRRIIAQRERLGRI